MRDYEGNGVQGTSTCLSRDASTPPATAGVQPALASPSECSILCVAFAARRARRCALRATLLPPPVTAGHVAGGRPTQDGTSVVASGATRSQQGEHVSVPLARRDFPAR